MQHGSRGSLFVSSITVPNDIQHTTKDLVGSFTRQDHLDSHSLDLSGQEVHGGRSSNGGDVEGLEVVNDLLNSIKTFLEGKGVFVVDCAQEIGSFSGSDQIGCTG